jgi:ABC-2 type transport system ATP-binding protein
MDQGKIIAQGSPNDLIDAHGGGISIVLPKSEYGAAVEQMPYRIKKIDGRFEIPVEDMNLVIEHLLNRGVDLTRMRVQTPNLETVFLNLTGRRLRE